MPERTVVEAVCPGCQLAVWHPYCTSVRAEDGHGERIDVTALERGERVVVHAGTLDGEDVPVVLSSTSDLEVLGVGWCGRVDLSVSWVDDAEWPKGWRCPDCGGTDFEGVHADSTEPAPGFEG